MIKLPLLKSIPAKIFAYILASTLFLICYYVPNLYPIFDYIFIHPSLIDRQIPFLPNSIWIYLSHFLMIAAAVLTESNDEEHSRLLYALMIGSLIAGAIFYLFPTLIVREKVQLDSASQFLWDFIYSADPESNNIPSLHVTYACIAAHFLKTKGKFLGYFAPFWAFMIGLTTLTTKQHYIYDVLTGYLVYLISIGAARKIKIDLTKKSEENREVKIIDSYN